MKKLLDDDVFRRRTVKVTFKDGDTRTTEINGTVQEIADYYIGNVFNLGDVEDRMVEATMIEFLQ